MALRVLKVQTSFFGATTTKNKKLKKSSIFNTQKIITGHSEALDLLSVKWKRNMLSKKPFWKTGKSCRENGHRRIKGREKPILYVKMWKYSCKATDAALNLFSLHVNVFDSAKFIFPTHANL